MKALIIVLLACYCCSCGGVEMVTQGGRIKLDNTLDSRLELISHQVISFALIEICTVRSFVYFLGASFGYQVEMISLEVVHRLS